MIGIESIQFFDSWTGKVKSEDLQRVGLTPMPKPYKRGACQMLYMNPVILANGKVNACSCRDVEAELIVGDLHQSQLSEIWSGEAIKTLIQRHEKGDFPDVCQRCTWYVSIYNRRETAIFKPLLNWNKEPSTDSFKLY